MHNQVDHRSYEKQGKLQIPNIHEGADARKIEQKFLAGQEDVYKRQERIRLMNDYIEQFGVEKKKGLDELLNYLKGKYKISVATATD